MDENIRDIKDILEYEQRMLEHSYYLIRMAPPFSLDIKVALESFLVHVRNVYDFLCKKKNPIYKDSDLNFTDCGLKKTTMQLPENNNIDQIDKFLAHITKRRLEKTPDWDVEKIFNIVDIKLKEFLNKLQ